MKTILLADNNKKFLNTRREILEKEGYRVITAQDPIEAREELIKGGIDLAILDIRLKEDDDDKDKSGLNIAKDPAFQSIPKIILTGYPSVGFVRESLKRRENGFSPALDFISKKEGPKSMIDSIERLMTLPRERISKLDPSNMSAQLENEYKESRKQDFLTYRVRLILIIGGCLVIFFGAICVILGYTNEGILFAVSGAVIEALLALFRNFPKK